MSISSEITRIKNNIASAYTALSDKGATLPVIQNSDNLATTVNSISSDETITVIGYCNFATYGSPNVDRMTGTVTNFSASNYLTIGNIDLTTADSWEAVSCFSITSAGKYQFWYYNPLAIGLDSSNHLHIWGLPDGDTYSNVTFGTNTTYWVKVEFTGTQYKAYRKTLKDGEWEQIISINSSNKVTATTTPTYIGLNPNNTAEYFYGYIDLSECYIKVDDVVVWSPSGLPSSFIVGSLTENDKKLSGFSESNYVDTNYKYSVTSFDRVDIQVHFKTPATAFSSYENLIMLTSGWFKGINIAVMPNNSGFMFMYQSEQAFIYTTLQTDTEYWVKFSSQGNGLIRFYYSTDGNTWATGGYDYIFNAFQSDLPVRIGKKEGNPAVSFEGQIYRDGTLIKINDNIVWSLTPVEEGNSGGKIITVTNTSSQNVQKGDKVWINGSNIVDFSNKTVDDADIFGNVVITEGIASGFSTGDSYINIGSLNLNTANTWSMETEVTTDGDVTTFQNIFVENRANFNSYLGLADGFFRIAFSTTHDVWFTTVTGTIPVLANSTYKVKVEFTGTAYNLYVNDVLDVSYASTTKLLQWAWNIGGANTNNPVYYSPFLGTINIDKTNVVIDNKSMFPKILVNINEDSLTGIAKNDITVGETGNASVGGYINNYDGLDINYATGGFITINGGALSDYSSVEGTTGCLQEKASEYNNIVQIGEVSVIKETGVVSNFSTSSYLKIPNKFTSIFNSWTRQICFTTGNDISTVQFLISDYDYDGVVFGISEGKLIWYASSDGGSWDILNGVTGITNLSANTKYWARLVFDGNIYKCYLSTTGAFSGEETTEISVTTFTRIKANCDTFLGCQIMSGSNYLPFLGSISLSDTYIMIDNDSWWTPLGDKKYTVTTDLYNNFTVIGTPVIDEISGVGTGFSSSNYLQTTYQFSATQSQLANGLIVQAHIRTPKTNVSRPQWVFGNNAGWDKSVGLLLNSGNVIQGIIADDNSIADNITGGFNLELDTEYWIRIYKPDNSSVAMLQLSYDGINWLTDRRGEVETYNDLSTTTTTTFGTTGEQSFSGTIYLDDTFIEVGGVKVCSPVSSGTIELSGLLAEGVSTQASLYNVFYNSDNGFIMDTTSTKQGYSWCGSVEVSI